MVDSIRDRVSWSHGPHFEINCWANEEWGKLIRESAQQAISKMGLDGAYGSLSDLQNRTNRLPDWRSGSDFMARWSLSANCSVGTLISLCPDDPRHVCLSIPPKHMEAAFGPFPWNTRGDWISDAIVEAHQQIIASVRRLHSQVPLRAALIREEGWPFVSEISTNGILLHAEVARRAGIVGTQIDDYLITSFE